MHGCRRVRQVYGSPGNREDDARGDTIHATETGLAECRASSTFEQQRRCRMGQVVENEVDWLCTELRRDPLDESRHRLTSAGCQENTMTPTKALVGLLRESPERPLRVSRAKKIH
ncbi:unnamed protein product [Heligmosomoides polygyrus]|uniref:Uncharacterized protein n=1 Tax=Heligmosomoides polygyrus TaxID=6339 RepID=A0A183FV48_HELPZ|nr:unnamed protein product [Heligmosomoides polygyrus]